MTAQRARAPLAVGAEPPPHARPSVAAAEAAAVVSPARELQEGLATAFEGVGEAATPRWPGAVRLALLGGGSIALWAGAISVVKLMLGALAA